MSGSPFGILEAEASENAADAQTKAAEQATQAQLEMYYQSRADMAPWVQTGAGALGALWGTPASAAQTIQGAPIYASGGTPTSGGTGLADFTWVLDPETNQPIKQYTYGAAGQAYATNGNQQIIGYQPSTTIPATAGTTGLIQQGPGQFVPEEDPGYKFGYQEFVENPTLSLASATGKLGSGATLKALTRYASDYASTKYDNFLDRYYKSLDPYMRLAGLGSNVAVSGGNQATATGQGVANSTLAGGAGAAAGYLGQASAYGNAMGQAGNTLGNYFTQNSMFNNSSNQLAGYGGWGGADYLAGSAAASEIPYGMYFI